MPLFGGGAYDIANEREGDVPFEEQLRGLEDVIKAGKVWVGGWARAACMRACGGRHIGVVQWRCLLQHQNTSLQ